MIEKYINLKIKELKGVSQKRKIRRNGSLMRANPKSILTIRKAYSSRSQSFDTITIAPDVASRILNFLNEAQNANAITDYELRNNPESKGQGYSIGEKVAQRILDKRSNMLPFQQFTDLSQLEEVQGLGQDKIQDLVYTFSESKSPSTNSEMGNIRG